jgi:hypothetical protein
VVSGPNISFQHDVAMSGKIKSSSSRFMLKNVWMFDFIKAFAFFVTAKLGIFSLLTKFFEA